jgi:hypothetical protein
MILFCFQVISWIFIWTNMNQHEPTWTNNAKTLMCQAAGWNGHGMFGSGLRLPGGMRQGDSSWDSWCTLDVRGEVALSQHV